jgi:hypothetical protein
MIKSLHPENFPRIVPLILIAISLMIGILTFKSYGTSWDEYSSYDYGREALSAYSHPAVEPTYTDSDGVLKYYGPAYFITGAVLVKTFGWRGNNIRHLFNFLTYLLAVVALYTLLTRWFKPAVTFAAMLLFVSQPLFWGHAFINPKDIPFMAFFLVSLVSGFWMADKSVTTTGWQRILLPILPGLLLGYTTSTRIIAPLAGIIVSLLALYRSRLKALPLLVIYWFVAAFATYATWPFLWPDPFNRFLASLRVMTSFPWQHKVLFDGIYYYADNLPWRYLPKLMALQFTEPVLLFGLAGAIVLAWKIWKKKVDAVLLVMLFIWFIAPLAWTVITKPTMYDNFRQFLFIMPPIFIFCALALDELFKRLTSSKVRAIVLLLAVLPSLIASFRLHPYEYVYYNSLAGNVAGRYETDYWATSFSEAANYINQNAPQNAVVSIGPWGLMQDILRRDLQIDRSEVSAKSDYVIIFNRWDYEKNPAFTGKPVYTVGRRGAVFLVVQRMK